MFFVFAIHKISKASSEDAEFHEIFNIKAYLYSFFSIFTDNFVNCAQIHKNNKQNTII